AALDKRKHIAVLETAIKSKENNRECTLNKCMLLKLQTLMAPYNALGKKYAETYGHKKRSTAVLQPLLTLNLIL
uniref:hypothetical protein n=1 Tax=Prevotella heparinolytica TaxID=28113 RepID=UPI0035A07311